MTTRFLPVLFLLGLIPGKADLSWQYTDERRQQAEEARKQQERIEQIEKSEREPSPEEQAAYSKLGKALAEHPEMASVNLAESKALADYQSASKSGNELELSLATQQLAEAKVKRFQKAASIPELKRLIEDWQRTTLPVDTPETQAEAGKNSKVIREKLGDLLKRTQP